MSLMTVLQYKLSFNTPAFLGNAQQQAQWRTPPIKALIRQWWRVVKAESVGYDVAKLLVDEGKIFGAAGDDSQSMGRSHVLIRLEHWDTGLLMPPPGDFVDHRESPVKKVAANTYLGYGPIGTRNDRPSLDPAKAQNLLRLRVQEHDANSKLTSEVVQAINLAAWFGGLGSRSRNAFGSVNWVAHGDTPKIEPLSPNALQRVTMDFGRALKRDWPHAVGADGTGCLVWLTRKHPSWMSVMKELACLKIALRTSPFFEFTSGGTYGHAQPLARHVLAYPAGGKHAVSAIGWGKDGRMANQLRLRVQKCGDGYCGLIVHIPCGVPSHMRGTVRLPDEHLVWQTVHRFFDGRQELTRLGDCSK